MTSLHWFNVSAALFILLLPSCPNIPRIRHYHLHVPLPCKCKPISHGLAILSASSEVVIIPTSIRPNSPHCYLDSLLFRNIVPLGEGWDWLPSVLHTPEGAGIVCFTKMSTCDSTTKYLGPESIVVESLSIVLHC